MQVICVKWQNNFVRSKLVEIFAMKISNSSHFLTFGLHNTNIAIGKISKEILRIKTITIASASASANHPYLQSRTELRRASSRHRAESIQRRLWLLLYSPCLMSEHSTTARCQLLKHGKFIPELKSFARAGETIVMLW